MLRPILAALVLATALPAAAETDTLHYNMIEFAESAHLEITRDTMTAYFSIASEGKDRATVNKAFQKKFNDFNKAVQNNKLQTEILNRSASPRYEYNNNGKRIQTGWEEEAVFKVESKDFDAINRLYREHPGALRVVDPVMGDGGQKYPTYTDEMCEATAQLVDGADLLTPNLTEASILTHIPYQGQDASEAYVERVTDTLLDMGAKCVVLKGIARGDGKVRNYLIGRDFGLVEVVKEQLPYMLHGTGDLYASGLLAAIMAGRSLLDAVRFAGDFVYDAMVATRSQPDFELRGVSFEGVLGEVTDLLR